MNLNQKLLLIVFASVWPAKILGFNRLDGSESLMLSGPTVVTPATGETDHVQRGSIRVSRSHGTLSVIDSHASAGPLRQELENRLSVGRGAWGISPAASELALIKDVVLRLAGALDAKSNEVSVLTAKTTSLQVRVDQLELKATKKSNLCSCLSAWCCLKK